MIWNPDQIDLFKALYLAETPATQIADQFGIDKKTVYRQASKFGIKRAYYKPIVQLKPLVSQYKPKARVMSLLELKHDQCRYIVGDVKVSYGFCGAKVHKGPWCKQCAEVVYVS